MTPPLPDRIAAAIDNYRARCRTLDEADCYGSMDRASYDEQRKGVLDARDALDAAIAEVVAERNALRSERDSALLVLPACCGSLADAADTLRQERDDLQVSNSNLIAGMLQQDKLRAQLAAANAQRDEARAVVNSVCELIDGSDGGVRASAADVWNYCTKKLTEWAIARAQSGQTAAGGGA